TGESDFELSISNIVQTSDRELEFDIFILDADASQDFELATFQAGILLNSSIYTGGSISVSLVASSSSLLASQVPTTTSFAATLSGYPGVSLIRMAARTPPGTGNGTIISKVSPGDRIIRMRLTSTVPFTSNSTPDFSFTSNTVSNPFYGTKVAQYIAGINTQLVVSPGVNALVTENPVLNPGSSTWTGEVSDSWSASSNWNNGVPGEMDNAIIPVVATNYYYPVVRIAAACKDLTIKPGSALTVDATGSLSVTGTFTLESDATGTGSFITDGATSANIQRYIPGHNGDANEGWHLLSSPVSAQTIGDFHTAGSGDDFYKWEETTGTWINRTAVGGGLNGSFENNFGVGAGYLVANATTDTKLFTGSLNTSNVSINNLTNTGANTYAGWHLLGNPFSSSLTWNNGNWALNNVDANCQIWNESTASYTVISATGIIPATNGFMVHASVNNASLTIPASARTHDATNWYKNTQTSDRIVLTAIDAEGGTAQSSIIRFDANATDGYDTEYDSYYLAGFAPLFYSSSQNENYALNTLTELTGGLTIPMGFVKNSSTQFIIELTENIAGQTVYLTDLKTNQTNNLTEGSYTFGSQDGDDANRFLLHFGTLGIDNPPADQRISAWVYNKQLYILSDETGDAKVYDIQGRLLQNYPIGSSGLQSYPVNLPSGVYLLRLQEKSSTKSVKIIVQ
ncbi:MAG: hypothetical protein CVU14_06305, partial [Bacteroidetes bacterium HGW-Bacteroidetes-9]